MKTQEEYYNSLSDSVKQLVDARDYEKALSETTSYSEMRAVVNIYLMKMPYWNRVSDAQPALEKIFLELGFNSNENPFIDFITNYYTSAKYANTDLTNSNFIVLNDLYAKSIIDFIDIIGKNYEGLESVFYNKSFYEKSESDEMFIGTTYMWLGESYNLKKLNFDAIIADNNKMIPIEIKKKLKSIITGENVNTSDIRDAIIYKNGYKSDVYDKNTIESILTVGSFRIGKERSSSYYDKNKKLLKDIKELSSEEKEEFFKNLEQTNDYREFKRDRSIY